MKFSSVSMPGHFVECTETLTIRSMVDLQSNPLFCEKKLVHFHIFNMGINVGKQNLILD